MNELTKIRKATETFFSVKLDRKSKVGEVVFARQCAIHYMVVKYRLDVGWGAKVSWVSIARSCGVSSHATAIHHYKQMKGYIEVDWHTRDMYEKFVKHIEGGD